MNFKNRPIREEIKKVNSMLWTIVLTLLIIILFSFIGRTLLKAEEQPIKQEIKSAWDYATEAEPYKKAEPFGDNSDVEDLKPLTKKEIKIIIKAKADKSGINSDNLIKLAICESSLNLFAFNGKDPAGGSKGLFQINGIHKVGDECVYDLECSTNWTIKQIKKGKSKMWSCVKIKNLTF